jgi:diketogulonate reductase-like aldo/keto reductase
MTELTLDIDGVTVPRFLYGTAWKGERSRDLTALALAEGFRGIDTANQRKHYFEAGVGEGIGAAIADGTVAREDLFLQTKFTYRRGQDDRLPYDASAPAPQQVVQSLDNSLEHLGVEAVDSLVLHGPIKCAGWTNIDRDTWQAMEGLVDAGKVRLLGISNCAVEQVASLCKSARIRPRFVQNRCHATRAWDKAMRAFCVRNRIVYQGFSLLTANRQVLDHPTLATIAGRYRVSIAQVVFRFAMQVGMVPLTGTTDADHMRQDLGVFDFELDRIELATIEGLGLED